MEISNRPTNPPLPPWQHFLRCRLGSFAPTKQHNNISSKQYLDDINRKRESCGSSCHGHKNKRINPPIRKNFKIPFIEIPHNHSRFGPPSGGILQHIDNLINWSGLNIKIGLDRKIRPSNSPRWERLHFLKLQFQTSGVSFESAGQGFAGGAGEN